MRRHELRGHRARGVPRPSGKGKKRRKRATFSASEKKGGSLLDLMDAEGNATRREPKKKEGFGKVINRPAVAEGRD